ncbi:hypothetical protein MYX04_08535 [Nitrospiraceae bacterium AH_259_D15_M11_P09]|nr:hypothetical protein [Nitrospiraceae bacterium AH_259_D15_M11_P09]
MKHTPMAMILLLGILALWGTEPRSASSEQRDVEIVEVDIQYEPGEVRITRGQPIRIINQDPFFHMTRISRLEEDGTEGPGVFGPHVELPDTNVEVRLTEPGHYKLRCLIHDGMTAIVQVIG